jgi:hypothetical protein
MPAPAKLAKKQGFSAGRRASFFTAAQHNKSAAPRGKLAAGQHF